MRRRRRVPFSDYDFDLPDDPPDLPTFSPSELMRAFEKLFGPGEARGERLRPLARQIRCGGDFETLLELDRSSGGRISAVDLAWARFGLSRDPGPKAPMALRRAEALLAGRDPKLIEGWHGNDSRRRTVQMAWELMEGDFEAASRRKGRFLPPKAQGQDWWVGLARAGLGEVGEALKRLADAPEPLQCVVNALSGVGTPIGPAAAYATALQAGDVQTAARAVSDGVADDMASARIAAAAAWMPANRGAANRHLFELADPFLRALWRVRLGLVDPARGWMEVGLQATGWRTPAAPLAFLRAASAFRAVGMEKEARRALALAGEGARRFPSEREAVDNADASTLVLQLARNDPEECTAWQAATLVSIQLHGWAAGVKVAQEADSHGCGCGWSTLLAFLERGVAQRDPRVLGWLPEIRGLPGTPQALVLGLLGRVNPQQVPDALSHALAGLAPEAATSLTRLVGRALPSTYWTHAAITEHARRFWLADPTGLADGIDALPPPALNHLARLITDEAPPATRDVLHVALAEACLASGKALPGATLSRFMAGDPAHWDDYVLTRVRRRSKIPSLAPIQAQEAFQKGRYVFRSTQADLDRLDSEFDDQRSLMTRFVSVLPEINRFLADLPARGLGAFHGADTPAPGAHDRGRADRSAWKAKKKAEKKARKQARKRR